MARIIVVTSGKGGVGKTTSSASFSTGLALRGHKTAVLDFDVGLRNLDLIITAAVNNGAEIIADGSIHVYAPMHGRALAGASGNAGSRIFGLSLQPELVSIAGVYRTFDDGFPAELARQPAQIRLVGDRLDISSLTPASTRV